ncbi:MAG: hypothetical protein EBR29_08240, partial [Sphingobacteriia bacterium]|nr:hypothetical protein [Sphingobacteriia bacterium]
SGGPAEGGATCAAGGCHGPASNTVVNTLISTSPSLASGYIPGATYSITITVSGSGSKGFQFSAQSSSGNPLGTLTVPASLQIQQNRWVTHRSAVSGSQATWTFNWVAPAAGSGTVGFYACGISGRNNSLVRQTLSIPQSTVSVNEIAVKSPVRCWPQPARNEINLGWEQQAPAKARWEILTMDGKSAQRWPFQNLESGSLQERLDLNGLNLASGTYYLQLLDNNGQSLLRQKITVHP